VSASSFSSFLYTFCLFRPLSHSPIGVCVCVCIKSKVNERGRIDLFAEFTVSRINNVILFFSLLSSCCLTVLSHLTRTLFLPRLRPTSYSSSFRTSSLSLSISRPSNHFFMLSSSLLLFAAFYVCLSSFSSIPSLNRQSRHETAFSTLE